MQIKETIITLLNLCSVQTDEDIEQKRNKKDQPKPWNRVVEVEVCSELKCEINCVGEHDQKAENHLVEVPDKKKDISGSEYRQYSQLFEYHLPVDVFEVLGQSSSDVFEGDLGPEEEFVGSQVIDQLHLFDRYRRLGAFQILYETLYDLDVKELIALRGQIR